MWRYNNVRFIFDNKVDSIHGQTASFPYILTYIKSKYALMQALNVYVDDSFNGKFAEIDPKSVKFDPPIKDNK